MIVKRNKPEQNFFHCQNFWWPFFPSKLCKIRYFLVHISELRMRMRTADIWPYLTTKAFPGLAMSAPRQVPGSVSWVQGGLSGETACSDLRCSTTVQVLREKILTLVTPASLGGQCPLGTTSTWTSGAWVCQCIKIVYFSVPPILWISPSTLCVSLLHIFKERVHIQ